MYGALSYLCTRRRASELSHIGTHNVLSKGKDRKQHKTLQTFGLSVAYKACNMGTHHQMMHFISNMQVPPLPLLS